MSLLRSMLASAAMGAAIGGTGVTVSSLLQVGRMPPTQHVLGAAGFMGSVLGIGSVVRQR